MIPPNDNLSRQAEKEEAADDEGKKKRGGIRVPEEWPWEEAKKLFEKPDVLSADEIEVSLTHDSSRTSRLSATQLDWKSPDVDGLVDFLVREKGFK